MGIKLTKFFGIVWKTRSNFSKQQMLRFYKAYVFPTITYAILISGNTSQSHHTEIMKLQKKILRTIFFKRRHESIKEILDENRLLTVFLIYTFLRCLNTCLWNCNRTKKIVFYLRFTPKKWTMFQEQNESVIIESNFSTTAKQRSLILVQFLKLEYNLHQSRNVEIILNL